MLSCQKVGQLALGLVLAAALADLLHSEMDGFGHAADDAAGLITGVRFPDQHVSGLAWTLLGSILTHDFVRQLSRHPGDNVEGMWRMLQPETPDNHVLATGRKNAVRLFVTLPFTCAGIDIVWDGECIAERGFGRNTGSILFEVDPRCFRPTEVDLLLGDTSKARRPLGRELRMPFEQMTAELVTSDIRLLERAKLLDRVRSPDGTGR